MGCGGSNAAGVANPVASQPQGIMKEVRDPRMPKETVMLKPEDFKVGPYIQTGAMGKVYKGFKKPNDTAFAMKFFGYTAKTPDINEVYEEINLMTALKGVPGMVQLEGVFMDPPEGMLPGKRFPVEMPVIVMEHLSGGDLMDRILMKKFVSEKQLAAIFRRIILTLKECHARGYIHRDLKLENLIFESNKDDALVNIIDFGMMVKLGKNKTDYHTLLIQGTPGYLAPETITEMEYSAKTDFFAAGCCFYAMLSGEMPFDPSDPRAPSRIPFAPMNGNAWVHISEEAKSFVAFLLQPDKQLRPDADQILAHPWLSGDANDQNLDVAYFSRLKALAFRQKIRSFFIDNNIWDNNRKRQKRLNKVVPGFRNLNSPQRNSLPGFDLHTIDENEGLKQDYEKRLHKLRAVVVKTLKPDFCFDDVSVTGDEVGSGDEDNGAFVSRNRQPSISTVLSNFENIDELSETFRKYVLHNGEIPVEGFIELLKCVGLDEFATVDVFKIFDTEKNGSVDMKDFLLTMLAMKHVELPAVVPLDSSTATKDNITLTRRSTALRLDDDAKLYFDMFDVKQTGFIDIDELKLVMDFMVPPEDSGEVMNKHIEEMFDLMDTGRNGRIDFNEFSAFYTAVMTATTKQNIDAPKSMSFMKAIDIVKSGTNSGNIMRSRSVSMEKTGDKSEMSRNGSLDIGDLAQT